MADRDPIADLVNDLAAHGQPSLAWVTRWSEGGREPVHAAWTVSCDPDAMSELLARVWDRDDPANDDSPYWAARAAVYAAMLEVSGTVETKQAASAAVREAVPVPPTLEQLLAAGRAR